MKYITKIFAALLVVMLIMINFNVEYSLAPIELQVGVELNTAKAGDEWAEDFKLEERTCWATGEKFNMCVSNPPYYCEIGAQDACSNTDPEVN